MRFETIGIAVARWTSPDAVGTAPPVAYRVVGCGAGAVMSPPHTAAALPRVISGDAMILCFFVEQRAIHAFLQP